jgi:hypothetical protein
VREREEKDKRRMSRVGEKIRKRLSIRSVIPLCRWVGCGTDPKLRYQDPLPSIDTPPFPSNASSTDATPRNQPAPQFAIDSIIPTSYTSRLLVPPTTGTTTTLGVEALNNKFASYSLGPGAEGRKGSTAYARRTSRFDAGPSVPPAFVRGGSGGGAFAGIEEDEDEGDAAVIQPARQGGQRWDLEALKDDHVNLNACELLYW